MKKQVSILLVLLSLLLAACGRTPATETSRPTDTATPVLTSTPVSQARTPDPTPSPESTPTPTARPTNPPAPTATPANTPTPTNTRPPTATPTPLPTDTPTPVPEPIPPGPASVSASMPDSVSPRILGTDAFGKMQKNWSYQVTFTEQNGVPATVDRIEETFVAPNGDEFIRLGGADRSSEETVIPGKGSAKWDSGVSNVQAGIVVNRSGWTVRIEYSGTDANGNEFSGSVSTVLE